MTGREKKKNRGGMAFFLFLPHFWKNLFRLISGAEWQWLVFPFWQRREKWKFVTPPPSSLLFSSTATCHNFPRKRRGARHEIKSFFLSSSSCWLCWQGASSERLLCFLVSLGGIICCTQPAVPQKKRRKKKHSQLVQEIPLQLRSGTAKIAQLRFSTEAQLGVREIEREAKSAKK